jgi:hypothetical protein
MTQFQQGKMCVLDCCHNGSFQDTADMSLLGQSVQVAFRVSIACLASAEEPEHADWKTVDKGRSHRAPK